MILTDMQENMGIIKEQTENDWILRKSWIKGQGHYHKITGDMSLLLKIFYSLQQKRFYNKSQRNHRRTYDDKGNDVAFAQYPAARCRDIQNGDAKKEARGSGAKWSKKTGYRPSSLYRRERRQTSVPSRRIDEPKRSTWVDQQDYSRELVRYFQKVIRLSDASDHHSNDQIRPKSGAENTWICLNSSGRILYHSGRWASENSPSSAHIKEKLKVQRPIRWAILHRTADKRYQLSETWLWKVLQKNSIPAEQQIKKNVRRIVYIGDKRG